MNPGLGRQVLIAVFLGIFAGIFLGPLATIFRPLATILVMLLQMVALPYISLSIVQGLSLMTPSMAKQLFKKSFPFWLLIWGVGFLIVFLMNALIPKVISIGVTFEAHPVSLSEDLVNNILTILIPENPISEFVNNSIPSIAVFGVIVGISLMYIEKKEPLLSLIDRGEEIIEKIFKWIIVVSPIGVFAHTAIVAGTIDFSVIGHYDFYLISFILAALFLIFWILPTILSDMTPMSFKKSVGAIVTVSLITFFTGITVIAIPLILLYLREMKEKAPWNNLPFLNCTSKTVVPLSYSFAQIGNCLFFFFILYASFYFRYPISGGEKTLLSILAIPLSIGSSSISLSNVSFLFKEMNFSDNAQQLFTTTAPLAINFQSALSTAGIFTLILLTLFANNQLLQIKWKPLLVKLTGSFALIAIFIFAISSRIHLEDNYTNLYFNRTISNAIGHPIDAKIYLPHDRPDIPKEQTTEDVLERVLRTGILRVGYDFSSSIPYVYHNRTGELVGFDIAMAYQLAQDLNCHLELIPLNFDRIGEELNANLYDIAMSAVLMTEQRILQMSFSDTYSDQNFNLIVPIKNKNLFADLDVVQQQKNLVIGAGGAYKRALSNFPNAITRQGDWETELEAGTVDAWVSSHIISIVWCLNHPGFVIQEYGGQMGKCYFAYPVRQDSLKFLRFINNWIKLKIQDNFYQKQYDYWIMGKSSQTHQKIRWSIIRNVLHWVE